MHVLYRFDYGRDAIAEPVTYPVSRRAKSKEVGQLTSCLYAVRMASCDASVRKPRVSQWRSMVESIVIEDYERCRGWAQTRDEEGHRLYRCAPGFRKSVESRSAQRKGA